MHAVFYQVGFILILYGEFLKNMGAAIIDFRVCPPLVKCQNLMFSGFIDTLMYGFSSTGVTIYCYFEATKKKQKKEKKCMQFFLSSRIYTDFVWGNITVIKKKNTYQVIYLLTCLLIWISIIYSLVILTSQIVKMKVISL
jgi:hypothetical protein